jgi:putative NADPH-quinone reductase
MKVFMVYWHAEPQSFNGALFQTAQETVTAIGHDVRTSDLYDMRFDPVSDRRNTVYVVACRSSSRSPPWGVNFRYSHLTAAHRSGGGLDEYQTRAGDGFQPRLTPGVSRL